MAPLRPRNFKTTIDVGNFLCIDEDPMIAVEHNLPSASSFILRTSIPGRAAIRRGTAGLKTLGSNYLLGSIIGFGDMDLRGTLAAIFASGYDGYASIEFKGNEDCLFPCAAGL